MRISITLEQLNKFLGRLQEIKRLALIDAEHVLEQTFIQDTMSQDHDNVLNIKKMSELRDLIRSGGQAKKAKPYNKEYLDRKRRLGENSPHKFMNYGFWMGTDIFSGSEKLTMKTKGIQNRGFSYLQFHETQRSVLKTTFLKSWQGIINIILARYAIEAQR
jgi:hypothetical protein